MLVRLLSITTPPSTNEATEKKSSPISSCLCVCQLPRGWFFMQSVHAFSSSLGIVLAPLDAIDFSSCPGPCMQTEISSSVSVQCPLQPVWHLIRLRVRYIKGRIAHLSTALNPAEGPVYQGAHCTSLYVCVVWVLAYYCL